ncbi:MAG: mechanosensitive ion channel [Gammaproteobacteria bacterium]|nr:mechanosensitive ion channel [Gammaproteobacteria bacterium]
MSPTFHHVLPGLLCTVLVMGMPQAAVHALAGDATIAQPPDSIAVELVRQSDLELRERLAARFSVIPGLEKTQIEVFGGVVILRGEASDDGRRQLATTLVEQTEGVIALDNQLGIDTGIVTRSQPVLEHMRAKLQRLVAALPLLLIAALMVFAADRVGRWLAARQRLSRRARRNPFLAGLTGQAIRVVVLLAVALVVLDLLNATALVGALLGTAGIIGIAVGFAFRDVAENYIAGILLSLRQPFAPHDHVVIDGHEGLVAALTSRATILITLDGNHLRLPNALVFKSVMLNYTRNPTRRFSFDLGIANEASISHTQRVIRNCLHDIEAIEAEPAPSVLVAELGDSSTVMRVSAWVDQRNASFGRVRSEAIRLVRRALAEAGIDMPDPGYRVELRRAGAKVPDAAARTREAAPVATDLAAESPTEGDVAVERHIDRQVETERAALAKADLLDPDAPRE